MVAVMTADATAESLRRVLSLDGTWQIAEGKMDTMPGRLLSVCPRPRFGGHGHALVRGTRSGGGKRDAIPQKDPHRDASGIGGPSRSKGRFRKRRR